MKVKRSKDGEGVGVRVSRPHGTDALEQGLVTFSVEGQRVNTSGFAFHMVLVATQLWRRKREGSDR